MAHFAKIEKETNKVLDVVKVDNDILTNNGQEPEENEKLGLDFLSEIYPDYNDYIWKQTSINDRIRGYYARVGGTYDENLNIFKPIKWNDSWVWNNEKLEWEAPIPRPEDEPNGSYIWDEELHQLDNTKGWVFVEFIEDDIPQE